MKRRNFNSLILTAPLLTALPTANLAFSKAISRIIPKKLKSGDTISIIAPGTAVSDPLDYQKAEEILELLELKWEYAPNVKQGSGYKTRSIKERVDDIHWAFSNDNSSAVFCLRGGYGSASLLPYLDYKMINNNPKIFCGYSDVTALHLAFFQKLNFVTYHGPVLLSTFSDYTFQNFRKVIFENYRKLELKNPQDNNGRDSFSIYSINKGRASGELVGGNLSLISSLMGTDFEINTKGRVLFIEDVGEEPYRLHRMMTQLKIAGKFNEAKGIIIGKCNDCGKSSGNTWDQSELEVYNEILGSYKYPIIYGFMIGHTSNQLTLPLGSVVTIDSEKKSILLN